MAAAIPSARTAREKITAFFMTTSVGNGNDSIKNSPAIT
jgi:hypothetical protein